MSFHNSNRITFLRVPAWRQLVSQAGAAGITPAGAAAAGPLATVTAHHSDAVWRIQCFWDRLANRYPGHTGKSEACRSSYIFEATTKSPLDTEGSALPRSDSDGRCQHKSSISSRNHTACLKSCGTGVLRLTTGQPSENPRQLSANWGRRQPEQSEPHAADRRSVRRMRCCRQMRQHH